MEEVVLQVEVRWSRVMMGRMMKLQLVKEVEERWLWVGDEEEMFLAMGLVFDIGSRKMKGWMEEWCCAFFASSHNESMASPFILCSLFFSPLFLSTTLSVLYAALSCATPLNHVPAIISLGSICSIGMHWPIRKLVTSLDGSLSCI